MPVCLRLNGGGPKYNCTKYGAAKRHGVHFTQYAVRQLPLCGILILHVFGLRDYSQVADRNTGKEY